MSAQLGRVVHDSHNLHYGISEVEFYQDRVAKKPVCLVTELEGFDVWP